MLREGFSARLGRLETGLSPHRPKGLEGDENNPGRRHARRWEPVWKGSVALFLALVVISAIDALAFKAGPAVSQRGETDSLVQPRPSGWAAAMQSGLTLQSKALAIRINGDNLTATYTVTAPAGSALEKRAETDEGSNAGNDLVDNVLGDVTVAEFRYGFTGFQYSPTYLSFQPPILTISTTQSSHKRLIDTVTVQSYPFRLYRHRQQIDVFMPNLGNGQPPPQIHVAAPGLQVSNPARLTVHDVGNGSAGLATANGFDGYQPMTFTLSEGNSGQGWQDGLRGVGGITIPFADPLLSRLGTLFIFFVLLWSFGAAGRKLAERRIEDGGIIDVARKAIWTVIVALAMVAVIGFAFDVSPSQVPSGDQADLRAWIAAGPLGLLVGGAALVWPAACWRQSRAPRARMENVDRRRLVVPVWLLRALPWVLYLSVAVLYWLLLNHLGANPLNDPPVIVATVLVILAVPLLVQRLSGGDGPLTVLASAGLLVVAFTATLGPALLWQGWESSPDVSVVGKWTYLVTAVLTAAGLCVLFGQVTWVIFHQYRGLVAVRSDERAEERISQLRSRMEPENADTHIGRLREDWASLPPAVTADYAPWPGSQSPPFAP